MTFPSLNGLCVPKFLGEANVYTLGDLGSHRVVTTKLPLIGNGKDALIATGSTTTRLLGTFQRVEHVFLVGVGGAVPHYTDFDKHVRKGDVVIATPVSSQDRCVIFLFVQSLLFRQEGIVSARIVQSMHFLSDLSRVQFGGDMVIIY